MFCFPISTCGSIACASHRYRQYAHTYNLCDINDRISSSFLVVYSVTNSSKDAV